MFRNFIVTAIRVAFKQKFTTALNILGMALGLAVSMILLMHVRYELSYDKHIPNVDRIYRIINHTYGDNARNWAATSTPIFHEITDFFPEIEAAVRIKQVGNISFSFNKDNGEQIQFEESGGLYADSTVFDVFGIKFLEGKAGYFYNDIYSLVITKSMAEKYFGDVEPIGKQLKTSNNVYTIKGVIDDCPKNSHLNYSFFIPYKLLKKNLINSGHSDLYYAKGWAGVLNYIKLKKNASIETVSNRMDDFTVHYYEADYGNPENPKDILLHQQLKLQAVKDIHLHSNLEGELSVNGNIAYIYIFIISIVFILIVVVSNYINIATTMALKRMKEIAIKKINGSAISLLKIQILGEALLTALLGGFVAILLIDLILPYYNQLADQQFTFNHFMATDNFLYFVSIIVLLGLLSGIYPAFFIAKLNPVLAIKGLNNPTNKSNKVRKILLIFQFVVSIFMIFSTIGIYKQMQFFQNKNLGFEKENLVSIKITGSLASYIYDNTIAFKEELKKLTAVVNMTYCSNIPGDRLSVEGLTILHRDQELSNHALRVQRVDKDYINTMGLKIIEGHDFLEDLPQNSSFIIGKKTAGILQLKNPVGWDAHPMFGNNGKIVGVIDDFHFITLRDPIEPIVLQYDMGSELKEWTINNVIIRIKPGNVKKQLEEIEYGIKKMVPDAVVNFIFIDDYLNSLYVSENKMSNLFLAFTLFTIFIACLGLFGVTSYNAELKTKEIGIRKVLGASNFILVKYLSAKFITFILISIVIALPLAYIFINNWLQSFAYHTTISVGTWIIAVVLSITIAFITILYHALRIAHKKPVDVLKYE